MCVKKKIEGSPHRKIARLIWGVGYIPSSSVFATMRSELGPSPTWVNARTHTLYAVHLLRPRMRAESSEPATVICWAAPTPWLEVALRYSTL